MPDFLTELGNPDERVISADSAIDRALADAACPEHLCLTDPDRVLAAHAAAIAAGASLIRTNTLAANAARLATHDLADHTNEINWTAVQLARQATSESASTVAGRVGPLPDSIPTPDRSALYRQQIGALLDAKVDVICLEGFRDPGDLAAAVEIKHELHHLPVLASLATVTDLDAAFRQLRHAEADLLGLDSISAAEILRALESSNPGEPLAVFPLAVFPLAAQLSSAERAALAARGCRLIGTN